MNPEKFLLSVYAEKESLTDDTLLQIFKQPISKGHCLLSSEYDNSAVFMESADSHLLGYFERQRKKQGDSNLDFSIVPYNKFTIGVNFGKKFDSITLECSYLFLDVFAQMGLGVPVVGRFPEGLKSVFNFGEFLVNFSSYIWNGIGGGYFAVGDSSSTYDSLAIQRLDLKQNLGHFWLAIARDDDFIPAFYSYGVDIDGNPLKKVPWYRRVKLNNGTLLLSSPLPYHSAFDKPDQTSEEKAKGLWAKTQWKSFEKRWKLLEEKE